VLLSGFTPFLSLDAGQTFQNMAPNLPGFFTNYSAIYGGNSGGFGVRSVIRSPVDHNYVPTLLIFFSFLSLLVFLT